MTAPAPTRAEEGRETQCTTVPEWVPVYLAERERALRAEAEVARLRERVATLEAALSLPRIEFHQQDFIPGFAAFLPGATTPAPESKAFCVLNLGSMLSTVYHGDTKREDLPYFLADSIMHEVIHVLEQWAGVEFSEDRVDALIEKYRTALEAPHEDN